MPKPGRKRKKPVTVAQIAAQAGATDQRIRQAGSDIDVIRETNQREQAVTVRLADWPLARLAKCGAIDRIHEAAGDQYHADAYNAGQIPSRAMDYGRDKVDISITDHAPDVKLDALDRFKSATKLLGPMTAPIVDAVCLEGIHPNELDGHPLMRRNRRDRTAQILWTLQIGLDTLAVHYRMKK